MIERNIMNEEETKYIAKKVKEIDRKNQRGKKRNVKKKQKKHILKELKGVLKRGKEQYKESSWKVGTIERTIKNKISLRIEEDAKDDRINKK